MNAKKMIINMGASIVAFLVQILISFWLSPYVVKALGEEAYGFLNLANSFVTYASLISVAFNAMACRFISVSYNNKDVDEARGYFVSVFVIDCILYAMIFVASLFLIINLQQFIRVSDSIVYEVKLTFLFSFLNMGISLLGTVFTAAAFSTNNMHLISLAQIFSNIIKSLLIIILFLFLIPKVYYYSIAVFISGIFIFICNYYMTKIMFKDIKIQIKYFDIKKVIILVKSGIWMFLSSLSNMLLNGMDLLLSNQLISSAVMGRISLAKQIPIAMSMILNNFSSIFTASLTQTFAIDSEKGLIKETNFLLRILTVSLTVPFSGILIYGIDFLKLWLKGAQYNDKQILQIYILMILSLADIIVSTYMYSIHSVFIALNKVRFYSICLFISSIISIFITIMLVKYTKLAEYAIVGTSTVILNITHGVIIPAYASYLLSKKITTFWISEIKSYALLALLCLIFGMLRYFFFINDWLDFISIAVINAIIGYILSFFIMLKKREREVLYSKLKMKIRHSIK